uniref:CBM9 n=1 Tax=uncultured Armatimonadetes bacterium TaxID=157466 RepID=A0A6J4HD62_9BACT|nr:CBM9 [uncultured Armatimonadetes bacterium]
MHPLLRAGRSLLFCLAVFGGVAAPGRGAAAQPAAAESRPGQVTGRAAWDENFVYFAFQVEDPSLAGTNTTPLSRPQEDDSVAVYLQVGEARPGAPNANTHAMIVSAAGGFVFLTGKDGALNPRTLFSIKYAVTLQGTLNRDGDRDQRYTVEMAIPWAAITPEGFKPEAGTTLGYNVVVRSRGGALTSLAEGVATEADVANPSKWTRLALGALAAVAPGGGVRLATRAGERPPLINGVLSADEWAEGGRYAFVSPERVPANIAPPSVPTPPTTAQVKLPPLPVGQPLGVERLLMARYVLGFQADPRRPTPFRGVRTREGRFLLTDQPANGAGPWFSADRPEWHARQLAEMRRVGIDVALTEVGGPDADVSFADEKALLVLVSALRQLAVEGVPTPQVALYLDTRGLVPAGAAKPDLGGDAGRGLLYRAVRRWFQIVPPEFRARVQLPARAGGLPAYPVFLSAASGLDGAGGGDWGEDLRRRFAADFGSDATILPVGGSDFSPGTAGIGAYVPLSKGGKGGGAVATFVVRPGYDDGAAPGGRQGTLTPRRNGATYAESWEAALAAKATWIIVDSWNDFQHGTELAASRQYGTRYADQTRIFALQFNGLQNRDIKWLAQNAPRRMRPGQVASVEVLLQNAGAATLRGADGTALSYRWLRGGKVVAEGPVRVPLASTLYPTQVGRVIVGLAAARPGEGAQLVPLEPGEYVARIDMTQIGEDKKPVWFGENGDTPLEIPVTIAADAPEDVSFQATTTLPLMQTGETYPVSVRLRWMGEETLSAEGARLTYQIFGRDAAEPLTSESVPIGQPLTPGQWVTVRVPLRLVDVGGSALAASFPEAQGGGLRLRWLLTRTQSTDPINGIYAERIALYPEDYEARVLPPAKVPESLDAGALVPMEITVVNRGTQKWSKDEMQVGYHWYFPDGVEAQWRSGVVTRIDREVEPGKSVKVSVPVRAPERDGAYVVAFDVTRGGDTWLSTLPVSRGGDLGLAYLRVTGGRLEFVDLEKLYDTDAVASENKPGDGNLDGKGATLPGESFPPDQFGVTASAGAFKRKNVPPPAYPSGYYADVSPTARLISFRYGPQTDGANNVVACKGQVVTVPRGRYTGLHLAVAATGGGDKPMPVVLRYKDNTTETVTRVAADWNRAPTNKEALAVVAHRKRTRDGDVGAACAVRHVIIPVSVGKELVSVTLPQDPVVKVFAVTLER